MRRRGVTLVEVVVGLALAALLAASAQSLVVHAFRTSRVLETESSASTERRFPMTWLRQDLLAAATTSDFQLRDGVLTLGTLNSANPSGLSTRHSVRVQYKVRDHALRRYEREPRAESWTMEAVLATDIQRAEFSVFDGRIWNSDWPPINYRPALALRIVLETKAGPPIAEVIALAPLKWSRHRD